MNSKKNKVYLDYNATAPLCPEAMEAVQDIVNQPLNASAVHGYGQQGRQIVEQARKNVAELINAPVSQVIFNSGTTEGNNTILQHFTHENARILVEATAHPCMLEPAKKSVHIPVDNNGIIDLTALEKLLSEERTHLVSFMLVNNETGVIQPAAKISALAHAKGALVHIDAVQAAGRIPIDMQNIGADFLTLSSHKIGGMQGVGALALGICGVTPVLLQGGGQEKYARAGTENVAGIAAFGAAAQAALGDLKNKSKINMRKFEAQLKDAIPNAIIHSENVKRVYNTSLFSLPNLPSEAALMALDLEGIAISNGSACTSGSVKSSHVLKAMGVADNLASCALRVSIGWNTSQDELDKLLDALTKIYARVKP